MFLTDADRGFGKCPMDHSKIKKKFQYNVMIEWVRKYIEARRKNRAVHLDCNQL